MVLGERTVENMSGEHCDFACTRTLYIDPFDQKKDSNQLEIVGLF